MENSSFKDFVLDQLDPLPGLRLKAMFGGYGLYWDERFFAILHRGRLYFKTNAETRLRYETKGMQAFRPSETQTLKSYYEVPVEILEDGDALKAWAASAAQCAEVKKKIKKKKP